MAKMAKGSVFAFVGHRNWHYSIDFKRFGISNLEAYSSRKSARRAMLRTAKEFRIKLVEGK